MFVKIRNFKFLSFGLFTVIFIFAGFLINTKSAFASTYNQEAKMSSEISFSSYKAIIFTENGKTSLTIVIGCAKGSGDIYDMNTGKLCTNNTKPVLVGCAQGSGDLYDVNTGKKCTNDTKPALIGCAKGSGDIYDMNTGKLCTNNTNNKNNYLTNIKKSENKIIVENGNDLINKSIGVDNDINSPLSNKGKMVKNLSASVNKMETIIRGPMSVWIIVFIIVILLGGGYGIYNLLKKDNEPKSESNTITPEINKTEQTL